MVHGQILYKYYGAQILEEGHHLRFHLQQQRLIELIREGQTQEALEFAQARTIMDLP